MSDNSICQSVRVVNKSSGKRQVSLLPFHGVLCLQTPKAVSLSISCSSAIWLYADISQHSFDTISIPGCPQTTFNFSTTSKLFQPFSSQARRERNPGVSNGTEPLKSLQLSCKRRHNGLPKNDVFRKNCSANGNNRHTSCQSTTRSNGACVLTSLRSDDEY